MIGNQIWDGRWPVSRVARPRKVSRARVAQISEEARNAFGRQVRAHRERLGMTQDALADILGEERQSYVSQIELAGKNYSHHGTLADALGFELEVISRPRG